MRLLTLLLLALLATGAQAREELEIEIRYRPDGSGQVRNNDLKVEEDEIEIRDFDQAREQAITPATFAELRQVVAEFVNDTRLLPGPDLDPPYIEISMEYQGESTEIEVTRRFAPGSVPAALVALQRKWFKQVYE